MDFDTAEVNGPNQSLQVVGHHIMGYPRFRADRDCFHPGRGPRKIFLVEIMAVDPFRVADQGERAVFEVGGEIRPDLYIEGHDIALGVAILWPKGFIQVFHRDAVAVDH